MHTTADATALLAAILAEPADDGARLVYADWLEERNEPGDAARAELICVQVELARIGPVGETAQDMRIGGKVQRLRRREHTLLSDHGAAWFRAARGMHPALPVDCDAFLYPAASVERNAWMYRPVPSMMRHRYFLGFERGFLGRFDGPAADWMDVGDILVKHQPIVDVTFLDRPSIQFNNVGIADYPPGVTIRYRLADGRGHGEGEDWRYGKASELDRYEPCVRALLKDRWPTVKTWNIPVEQHA